MANKHPFIIFISFLLSMLPFLAEASVCQSQKINNPLVRGRAEKIQFPDGREIIIVGHQHGSRQVMGMYSLMDEGSLYTMSNEEFKNFFKKILRENRKERRNLNPILRVSVSKQASEDFLFLDELIKLNRKIQFVGLEYAGEPSSFIEDRKNVLSAYYSEFLRRKRGGLNLSNGEFNEAMLSSMNGNVYYFVKNQRISQSIPLVGVESEKITELYDRVDPLKSMDKALKQLKRVDASYFDGLSRLQRSALKKNKRVKQFSIVLGNLYKDVVFMNLSMKDFKSRAQTIRLSSPSWVSDEVQAFLDTMKSRMHINQMRDSESAKNLANRYQSGVHFVGHNHFMNTLRALGEICQSERRQEGTYGKLKESSIDH